ncbi:MAG TPA: trypsin-like peptidase domain-containing protein [Jatrophihabitantaceae bacterium]|nr:trypsin-like peptidase domain-containing protein [Jatrophihabitantaceae bacterium]
MTESYPASNQPSGATWSYPPPAPPYSGYGPTDPGASDLPGGPAGGSYGPFDPPGPGGPTGPGGPDEPEQPRSRRSRTIVIAAVTAAVVGGGIGAGTVAAFDNSGNTTVVNSLPQNTQTAPSAAKIDGSISAAAAKIQASVVTIDVSSQQAQGNGSGVIIRNDGYIVTNDHVVSVAANGGTMTVLTNDGQQAKATIVGRDTSDDLAVIKVNGLKNLTAATFGKSSNLVVGQTVVAVGAPLGLANTVTSGIVSNTARPVRSGDNDQAVFDAIQTDAAINPGNSGGALADLNGNVVGINAAIATPNTGGLQIPGQDTQSGSIGIGFAIPADEVSRIAAQLISTGKATHAVIGVQVAPQQNSSQTTAGATLNKVDANSPAAKAGLKAADVVTRVNTQRIDDADALIAAIRSHAPGEKVSLTYTRAGQSKTVSVTLGSAAN